MAILSDNDVKLIIVAVGAICGLLGFFGRGLAFMVRRAVTGSKRQEDATYMASIVEIGAKLKQSGMTTSDVQQVLDIVRAPNILSSEAAVEAVTGSSEAQADVGLVIQQDETSDMAPWSPFDSNYAMKMRAGSALGVAEAELTQALTDLEILVRESEWKAVEAAQARWVEYREALTEYAYLEYEGGTHAGLAAGLAALAETERRAAQIRADVDERSRR